MLSSGLYEIKEVFIWTWASVSLSERERERWTFLRGHWSQSYQNNETTELLGALDVPHGVPVQRCSSSWIAWQPTLSTHAMLFHECLHLAQICQCIQWMHGSASSLNAVAGTLIHWSHGRHTCCRHSWKSYACMKWHGVGGTGWLFACLSTPCLCNVWTGLLFSPETRHSKICWKSFLFV